MPTVTQHNIGSIKKWMQERETRLRRESKMRHVVDDHERHASKDWYLVSVCPMIRGIRLSDCTAILGTDQTGLQVRGCENVLLVPTREA